MLRPECSPVRYCIGICSSLIQCLPDLLFKAASHKTDFTSPAIFPYLRSRRGAADDSLRRKHVDDVNTQFMQSDGGLTPVSSFRGSRAILSGPAGGVVGYAATSYDVSSKQPVIGFDMGGTSTGARTAARVRSIDYRGLL